MAVKAELMDFGGGFTEHFAKFTLWYDRSEAQITIRVKGPAPSQEDPVTAYRPLLHRLGAAVREVEESPQVLSLLSDRDAG
jgi:hypothetical protein